MLDLIHLMTTFNNKLLMLSLFFRLYQNNSFVLIYFLQIYKECLLDVLGNFYLFYYCQLLLHKLTRY